ncbi:Cupin-like domain-containing protein [Apibacter mensalis]|uniref:Cupin-like domain-containing protein n=1 Tax=Apibacter mensalis TaxID=1586267 RepID=A0A0X3AR13_9FLAO|nr:cupin-like domain-containing protein [Apibacter mensalis]CVK16693.1 Cupin-like domain-containing protein [Apibacter mensalis]
MFNYEVIDRVEKISKDEFYNQYYKPQKPVIIEKLTEDWPAYRKWNFDYIKKIAGDKIVPLYNNDPVSADKKVNEPDAKMKMTDYIDLLQKGPTDLRIFLFNILKQVPAMQEDFKFPDLGLNLFKSLPMLFFGGAGSNVFMHFDIDLANILHFHFAGEKQCILIKPQDTKYMYKIPYATICREDINFDNPDFVKWPGLKYITPYKAHLSHGEMLYMPEGWWHYMQYLTPSFSMSLRSLAKKPSNFINAVLNIFIKRNYDNFMRKKQGQKWIDYKNNRAIVNTNKAINLTK